MAPTASETELEIVADSLLPLAARRGQFLAFAERARAGCSEARGVVDGWLQWPTAAGVRATRAFAGAAIQGEVRGRCAPTGLPPRAIVAPLGNLLLVVGEEGLEAIDLRTLRSRWSYLAAGLTPRRVDLIGDEIVLADGRDVVALDPEHGLIAARCGLGGRVLDLAARGSLGVALVRSGGAHSLVGLDLGSTFEPTWELSLGTGPVPPLTLVGDTVVLPGEGEARHLSLATGEETPGRWRGRVLASDRRGVLTRCLVRETGEAFLEERAGPGGPRRFRLPDDRAGESSFALAGDLAVVLARLPARSGEPGGLELRAIERASGALRWRRRVGDPPRTAQRVAVAGGLVYLAGAGRDLRVSGFDLASGRRVFRCGFSVAADESPRGERALDLVAIDGGLAVVATVRGEGVVARIDGTSGSARLLARHDLALPRR